MTLQFEVGDGEFGEVYHLMATAYLLQQINQEIAICFKNFPDGEELFQFLSIDIVKYNPAAGFSPLPSTTNILQKHFSPGCLENLASIIRKSAQNKGWSFPYPELANKESKLLIWYRNKGYKKQRNCSVKMLEQLVDLCEHNATTPIILCHPPGLHGAIGLGEFYNNSFFKEGDSIAKQLWFFDMLFRSYGAIAQVVMMSGAMDGPNMLFGHKTVNLAKDRDAKPRLQKLIKAVPNFIWLPIEFNGNFEKLSAVELKELERKLWS